MTQMSRPVFEPDNSVDARADVQRGYASGNNGPGTYISLRADRDLPSKDCIESNKSIIANHRSGLRRVICIPRATWIGVTMANDTKDPTSLSDDRILTDETCDNTVIADSNAALKQCPIH